MVISISKKLWTLSFSDTSIYRSIKKILSWIEDGKHSLIFEKGIDTNQIVNSKEYYNYSEIIKSCVKRHYYSEDNNKKVVRITITNQLSIDDKRSFYDGLLLVQDFDGIEYHYIDISKIDTYLGRLLITVENIESDKRFIQAAYRTFRGRELCIEREVQFIHGGGNTIDRVVIENSIFPVRMICIIDSDRKFPEMPIKESKKVQDLLPICEQKNLVLIVLERREIENYLPLEALEAWLDKQRRSKEKDHPFFMFTQEQKAFFDLKKGLKKEDIENKKVQDLYNGYCSDDSQKVLINGFGKSVWQAFEEVAASTQNAFNDCELEITRMVGTIESLL